MRLFGSVSGSYGTSRHPELHRDLCSLNRRNCVTSAAMRSGPAVSAIHAPPADRQKAPTRGTPSVGSPEQEPEDGSLPLWTLEEYQKLFRNYRTEEQYVVDDVEGEIPSDLEGTFYRNGPGIMSLGGQRMHCFDGHGLIARVTLQNGQASFRSRYVQTQVLKEELEANDVLYRGFGSSKKGGPFVNALSPRDKPVANTSMLEWGGKLYALWEGNTPYVLDPATLETLGKETFGGALSDGQPFTAHPSWDRHTGRLVAFSNGIKNGEGKLQVWEIDAQNSIRKAVSHTVGALPVLYLHDFQVTKNWYIFHQAPLGLDALNTVRYNMGLCDATKQIFFDSGARGKWWMVPRDGGEPQHVETEPLMIWHYGNAFEDEKTGKVYIDACTFSSFSFNSFDMREPDTIPSSTVERFEISVPEKTSMRTTLMQHSADFPQTNPAFKGSGDYRYLYFAAAPGDTSGFPFRQVIKLDTSSKKKDVWLAPPGCFVGEPIFAPRKESKAEAVVADPQNSSGKLPKEDDGYVLALVSDGRKEHSSLAIFDAASISAGPICTINLKALLPMAFHCAWSQTAYA